MAITKRNGKYYDKNGAEVSQGFVDGIFKKVQRDAPYRRSCIVFCKKSRRTA